MADHPVIRAVGLHQHLPGPFPAPSAAGQLQHQLQAFFGSAHIRPVQLTISRQHRRQGHARQIHALGQHLRAHQHIGFAGRKLLQQPLMAIASAGGVAVKAQQPHPFELLLEGVHHPLGASAKRFEGRGAAMAAAVIDLLAVITPMAAQPAIAAAVAMHRQRHIAVGTHHHFTAAAAAQKGAVTAARHQHHRLLLPLRQLHQPVQQGAAQQAPVAAGQLLAHVHHMHWRQGAGGDAIAQLQ